jgi:hypothetical protein
LQSKSNFGLIWDNTLVSFISFECLIIDPPVSSLASLNLTISIAL